MTIACPSPIRSWVRVAIVAAVAMTARAATCPGQAPEAREGPTRPWWEDYRDSMGDQMALSGPPVLILAPAVQKELRLTPEQVEKLRLKDETISRLRYERQRELRNRGIFDGPEMEAVAAAMRRENLAETARILDDAQMRRLQEIALQVAGPMAVTWPEVQRRLDMPAAQVALVQEIKDRYQAARKSAAREKGEMFAAIGRAGDRLPDEGELRPGFEALRERSEGDYKRTVQAIEKVLSGRQEKKFNEMLGKPFEAIDALRRPGAVDWQKGYITRPDKDTAKTKG